MDDAQSFNIVPLKKTFCGNSIRRTKPIQWTEDDPRFIRLLVQVINARVLVKICCNIAIFHATCWTGQFHLLRKRKLIMKTIFWTCLCDARVRAFNNSRPYVFLLCFGPSPDQNCFSIMPLTSCMQMKRVVGGVGVCTAAHVHICVACIRLKSKPSLALVFFLTRPFGQTSA